MTEAQKRRLALAHIEGQRKLRVAAETAVLTVWRSLPGYDRENVDEWLSRVLPVLDATKRRSVALTDTYLARAVGRRPLRIDPVAVTGKIRAGAAPEEVYERPFITLWGHLGEGGLWQDAQAVALRRAMTTAATDVQLSMRQAVAEIGREDRDIYGFERVPNPGSCELCMIASTQRYHSFDLMPIHDNCGCGVAPITEPTGQVINRDLYRELKADGAMDRQTRQRMAARYQARADANRSRAQGWRDEMAGESDPDRRERLALRAERYEARAKEQEQKAATVELPTVKVVEHGELGPILTDAAHTHTKP